MIAYRRFREEPMTAAEAIQWLQTHRYIWYQAPMDFNPCKVYCTSLPKLWRRSPERFSIGVQTSELRFRIDNDHLSRLRMPNELWHHGVSATVSHVHYVGHARPDIVLHQSNGFHLSMTSLRRAIHFAKCQSMELTVRRLGRSGVRVRVLVPAHPPISGETNFHGM